MSRRRLQVLDYTVAWICALPIELAAATQMLDEKHDDIPQYGSDQDIFTLGRVGDHNVVIAHLPAGQTGTNPAAALATHVVSKFKSVRFGLMVGIGGGVPSALSDIRLGDVVVSQPNLQHPGVVQYDFGKTGIGGRFERTGSLNTPPAVLLNAIAKLRANHYLGRNASATYLSTIHHLPSFSPQRAGVDVLFDAAYHHVLGPTCNQCSMENKVQRSVRDASGPVIHYGTIASGNQVIKDGATRDKLSSDLGGVHCFEMEAAGLMNNLPCLVIRGICDYADSHKNKAWQGYASATAAAYAKEILSVVPAAEVVNTRTIDDHSISTQRQDHLDSLKFDQIDARHATITTAHRKTCRWLLDKPEYKDWNDVQKMAAHHGFLWIKGKPGTGKSTLMKFAYATAKRNMPSATVIAFFFNARGEELEKSVQGMYRSLLRQLLLGLPQLQVVLDALGPCMTRNHDLSGWHVDTLEKLLTHAVTSLGSHHVVCFIDALDECEEDLVRRMVAFFERLGELTIESHIQLHVCLSSRHYPHITIAKSIELVLEGQQGHRQDIAKYLRSELKPERSNLLDKIKDEILERASDIFLWVVLVVQILNKEYDRGRMHALRKRLNEIPNGLHELFNDILTRDNENIEGLALCLQWILYSKRPLKREELYFAVLSGLEPDEVTAWNPDDITSQDMERYILSTSKGLAETTKSKAQTVQFIHESVREFLLKGNGLKRLRPVSEESFDGLSHAHLKECCQTYMVRIVAQYPSISQPLPTAQSPEAAQLRQSSLQSYPLLEYAVHYVLPHTDEADGHGVSQVSFLSEFPLKDWIHLDNLFQRYQIRRHTSKASMLYILVEQNLAHLIQIELNRVPDMDIKGERYKFPILAALHSGNEATIRALLTPHLQGPFQEPLLLPTDLDRDKAVRLLLGEGLHYERDLIEGCRSILLKATRKGHTEIVKLLLHTNKIWVDWNLLMLEAAAYGHRDIVELFLSKGAELSAEVRNEGSALYKASDGGHYDVVKLLNSEGAKVNAQDGDDDTALHAASARGRYDVVNILLSLGADVNAQGGFYGSALHAASSEGHCDIVKLLLSRGAEVNAEDGDCDTALYAASRYGYNDVVELLLSWGAEVNAQGGFYGSALHAASSEGHCDIVKLLLSRGAEVNAEDGIGSTALKVAKEFHHTEVVELLLQHGAVDATS